jgi:DNA-binding NtrC family response regulator/GAF domain-containing protein
VDGRFPATAAELASPNWWGESEGGVIRLLDRVASDGSRLRLGSGPGWRELPSSFRPKKSDLLRPWGQLLACGVAQASSGAAQPLTVLVARPARPSADAQAGGVRLIGADRDPAPRLEDVRPPASGEVRRGVFNAERDLVAVLALEPRERDVPVLGAYSLTELLVAAGLTALFTAALFAGILTSSIVRPIERLDRAVREGRPATVQPAVQDEIGHLTGAISSFAGELARRVEQLETLRRAQEELSSHLDWEQACDGVLQFFRDQTGAVQAYLCWAGAGGEEPRLFGAQGTGRAPPAGRFFAEALGTSTVRVLEAGELDRLSEPERALFPGARSALLLPLSAGGERRGALVLAFASTRADEDQAFLRAAASQAAVVLENARLYQQASVDPVTGFLFDGGFKQRLSEEITRAAKGSVLLVQIRLGDLPADDARATARLREAARRMRAGVRGLAVFGRSGSADLRVALPQVGAAARVTGEALARNLVMRLSRDAWPDGEAVTGLSVSSAAWPQDGPSGRLVLHLLDERLAEARAGTDRGAREALRASLPPDFVAQSPLMLELLDTARRVAGEDLTVLVVGETGAGKDRVARLVHEWSPRREGPLVHIHCPSLPANLIEDELFGHVAGAFTGAVQHRVGPFEYAAGGTVVLDEVGGLPPEGQVALLRLIETREVLPIGSTRPVPLDVRIIATSSADLAAEVERGRFRSDLYFRLNVAQLAVPPLRLRRQDLPLLVAAAVERFNAQAQRPVTGVAPEVLDLLCDHPWPGNLRQLENALAGALLLAAGEELRLEHLPPLDGAAAAPGPVPRLNPRQLACLEATPPGAWISSSDHSRTHGVSARTGLRDLIELVDLGYLERQGSRRSTRFQRSRKGLWAERVGP